jgi:hypothetical protein
MTLAHRMRRMVTVEAVQTFMEELASAARSPGKVYLTGGATALLLGFRQQTIDIDLKLDPEPAGVFETIAGLKNRLDVNVELASPDDFIPEAPGWRERSRPIAIFGVVEFFHYDLGMQALCKIERGHAQDLSDAAEFVGRGLVTPEELRLRFSEIFPRLLRYPAIDPQQFRAKLEAFLAKQGQS